LRALDSYRTKKIEDSIAYLDSLEELLNEAEKEEQIDFYRILAFASANSGKFVESEKAALKGTSINPDDPDFHFALTYIYTNYQDYDRSLEHAERYVNLVSEIKRNKSGELLSHGFDHLMYNYLGLAYKAAGNYEQAESAFRKSIEIKPSYEHSYLNLISMYQGNNEFTLAEEVVEEGLKKCSQVQELRLVKKSLENRSTICACLIVKNEEELLPNCLESIRGWVDDIVVVDTGSTDRTVEIAREYGAKVYFKEWEGSFSKARNYSISKATGDWILYIDADEEFVQDDIHRVRQAMALDNCRLISVDIYNIKKETGECTSILSYPRIFRSDAGFKFAGRVHNQLQYDESEVIVQAGVRLKHYGYNLAPDKMKQKIARSTALLEQQLKDHPDDPFVHFNYAQILRSSEANPDEQLCNKILKHARIASELSNTRETGSLGVHLQALHQQATTHLKLGDYEDAKSICTRALELKPNYLDALFTLAEANAKLTNLDEAEQGFLKYLYEQETYDPAKEKISMIQLYALARHKAYYWLAMIASIRDNMQQAEEYFLKTLEELEPYNDTYLKLANIYLDRRDLDRAADYINRELEKSPDSDLAHLYKARLYGLKNMNSEAEPYLNRAVELTNDNPEILERAGVYWSEIMNYDKAIPILEKLAELKPDYEHGLYLLAKACYDGGQLEKALDWYEKYLLLRPDNAEMINDMATCLFKLERLEEAEEQFRRVIAIDDRIPIALRNLGLTELRLGKLQEAENYLKKYSDIVSDDPDLNMALGIIRFRQSDYANAIQHFERCLGINPQNIDCLFNISEAYLHLGYTDSAAIGYRQILKVRPDFEPAASRLNQIETAKTPV